VLRKEAMQEEQHLDRLEERFGYRFGNRALLLEALSHSSYVNENPDCGARSNERMEFLGDSVLGLIVTRHLYERYPLCSEGELTLMKSVLVSEGTLARIALDMRLGECLRLGKGEASTGGGERKSNLSNALEALVAAIYLDGGLAEATRVAEALFGEELRKIEAKRHSLNYKNLLQHYSQERDGAIPEYVLVSSQGPQHEKLFEVEVRLGGEPFGRGAGRNKKEAEQGAARAALEQLGKLEKKTE
jgi:ribonuclease-3